MNQAAKQFIKIYQQLPAAEQETLFAFAEFLLSRVESSSESELILEPEIIPRPAQETVIGAVKRLSKSYPMLDKSALLNETSSLVTANLVQGRDRAEVIDELETVFANAYQAFVDKKLVQ
ncbi:hypothetical protein [Candidatus Albibeggiatoa sp. nov. BB20]|uniref:hypothetical protein n=1 Tax=Candidatus Albibeggiatoa sp. nov. BB20 TaxID=3162723 RepID=UPI00336593F0